MQVYKPSLSLLSSPDYIHEEAAQRVATIPYLHKGDWMKCEEELAGVTLAQKGRKVCPWRNPMNLIQQVEILQLNKRCSFVRSPAMCTPTLQLFPFQ